MKRLFVLVILLFLTCGPEPIPDPEPALLTLPDNLNACNTATRVNNFQRQVRFQWAAGLHTDSYELVVVNNLTRQKKTTSTTLISESLVLTSGAPYQWYVVSKSLLTEGTGKSTVWQFYLEGNPEESHFPFPAVLLQPENESIVELNNSNSYSFQWNGADLDGDIKTYDLYLGESVDNLIKEKEGLINNQTELQLNKKAKYFWQVISIDSEGNQSHSEIFQFQTF